MFRIGIDPPKGIAVSENGVILKVIAVKTLTVLFKTLTDIFALPIHEVVIETPHGLGSRLGRGMPINVQRKISANIGQVYQSAQAIKAFCEAQNIPARLQLSNKWLTKINAERFKEITGYQDKTNEHGRDAAMLIFERKAGGKYGR